MLVHKRQLLIFMMSFFGGAQFTFGLPNFSNDFSSIDVPFSNSHSVSELLDRRQAIPASHLLGLPPSEMHEDFRTLASAVGVPASSSKLAKGRPPQVMELAVHRAQRGASGEVDIWAALEDTVISRVGIAIPAEREPVHQPNTVAVVDVVDRVARVVFEDQVQSGEELAEVPPQLKPPQALTNLSGLLANSQKTYNQLSVPYEPRKTIPSLRNTAKDSLTEQTPLVVRKFQKGLYKSIAIQVMDERSQREKGQIYPLEGVTVKLPGSDFSQKTSARGIVEISDIPAGARFFVTLKDDRGRILNQAVEIATEVDKSSELFRLKTFSYRSYYLYSNVFGLAQRTDLASVCIRAMSPDGAVPLGGITVSLDGEADGPFYMGDFGPQANMDLTGSNGRACFFNVEPGLSELNFFDGESYLSTVSLPLVRGFHLEDDIYLSNGSQINTYLISLPTGPQILYGDSLHQNQYFDVDFADMIAVGENSSLNYHSPGRLRIESGHTFYRGQLFSLSQAGEFETALYSFDTITQNSREEYVTPLLPRGFVEDVFNELYLSENLPSVGWDPALGSVFVRHGQQEGEQLENFNVRLVDHLGRDVRQAWLIGSADTGFLQAVFFNLEPGYYTVLIESGPNHWVDARTIPVDYWLTSVVQTGANLTPFIPEDTNEFSDQVSSLRSYADHP